MTVNHCPGMHRLPAQGSPKTDVWPRMMLAFQSAEAQLAHGPNGP